MCPKGDDPLSLAVGFRTIQITTSATSGQLTGVFQFFFNGEILNLTANATLFNSSVCTATFSSMRSIQSAKCIRSAVNSHGGSSFTVQLKSFPSIPYQNNIFVHDGYPSLNMFYCSPKKILTGTNPSCTITDVYQNSVPEYEYCSMRGICDFTSGNCNCYPGFNSSNCNTYHYGVRSISSSLYMDMIDVQTVKPTFTGNLVHINSIFSSTSAFNFVQYTDKTRTLASIDGGGSMHLNYG